MCSASVLRLLGSGPLPGGPVMSPIKCLDVFVKLEAGEGAFLSLISVVHYFRTHSSEKCSLSISFVIFIFGSVFSFT